MSTTYAYALPIVTTDMCETGDIMQTRYELRDDCGLMDENLNLGDFYAENDLEPEIVNAIGALEVGQRANVAGGASGIIFVVRVA